MNERAVEVEGVFGGDPTLGVSARHSSGSVEYGTPLDAIDAARAVMGGIELDPATSFELNERVRATQFFATDSYVRPWRARSVLLNPPGGRSDDLQRPVRPKCTQTGSCGLPPGHVHTGVQANTKKWWNKLVDEWAARRTKQAVFVGFSIEVVQTTQARPRSRVLPLEFAVCYPAARQRFWRDGATKNSPPHASCYVFLPPLPGPDGDWSSTAEAISRFRLHFGKLGQVVVPT